MRLLLERGYFGASQALGWLLRSARYSKARIVTDDHGARHVRKHRVFYAPLLISLSDPLVKILDTGVRVLPQPEWEEQERRIYQSLYKTSIERNGGETLVLPCFDGQTLATLLDNPALDDAARKKAIESAVAALAEFHRLGFTHGDAMAENVMIDVDAGPGGAAARWFDFETVHDSRGRCMEWRRSDDLRALMVTCLIRTAPDKRAETVQFILDAYADEHVTRFLAATFASTLRRALPFHLAQASLSYQSFVECARLVRQRAGC
jgi:serine/threonine protein kinase